MGSSTTEGGRPPATRDNLAVALRHPSLILAMARGADRLELQRILARKTIFKEMNSLLDETRSAARRRAPLPQAPKEALTTLHTLCEGLAAGDKKHRGDAYYTALYTLVKEFARGPVVETGVWWGTSSMFMLQAMEDGRGGTLNSVDLPNASYSVTASDSHADIIPSPTDTGAIIPASLRKRWKLTLGKSKDVLPGVLDGLGPIDIFVHDSEHVPETMTFEFEEAWRHLRPGGFLISDDTDWNGSFAEFAEGKGALSMEFTKYGKNRFGVMVR